VPQCFLTSFANDSRISILSVGMARIRDLLNLLNRIDDDEMRLQSLKVVERRRLPGQMRYSDVRYYV
jgi:hypothetical protein